MPYREFDRSRLELLPLAQREHDLDLSVVRALEDPVEPWESPELDALAQRLLAAREARAARILMMGAHVLRKGNARYIIELMRQGLFTHVACNGATAIHDFEFALIGATTESVARYIRNGQFGLWRETGWINDAVNDGASRGLGFGESVGRFILEREMPHREVSILAAGVELGVPVTVHVGLGNDIIHEHPNFDGAATGLASYRDFLIFAAAVEGLESGVFLNAGTAVMGPEVYLKALSMARNVARQEGRQIAHFTTAVLDLAPLGPDAHAQPEKSNPSYYFRPWKTILIRTVQDGGESFYVRGDHGVTFPGLYQRLTKT